MALVDLKKFNELLQKGDMASVYLLYGEENYLIREALSRLKKLALQGALEEFNCDIFFGLDLNVSKLKDTIETLPMMAEKRLVIVKEIQELNAKQLEELMDIVENPIESTVVIFVAQKIDQRKKVFKKMIDIGVAIEFSRLPDEQVPAWVSHMAQQYGKTITKEAILSIQERVGNGLDDVSNEILKLVQYIGERNRIEVQDVATLVSKTKVESIFELATAIGQNDRARALDCLANLLDNGEEPIGVMALVNRHVRILMLVQEGLKAGLSSYQLSSKVGVPPYYLKDYVEQSRRWSKQKLFSTHCALLDTDKALKSSPVASHIWLENFIVQTCGLN